METLNISSDTIDSHNFLSQNGYLLYVESPVSWLTMLTSSRVPVSAHLGTMFGSDALITTFTIICMLRTGQRVVTSKRSLLSRFVRFTVFSAAIPAIL